MALPFDPRPVLATALAAALAAAPSAQQFTSPAGLLIKEGDASHFALFNPAYERFMQIDDTWRGTARAGIKAIAFRQDGETVGLYAASRTLDLTVRMGEADWNTIGSAFAANYRTGPATVFTSKQIKTPDWSQLPGRFPAPFDLRLPYDTPFGYSGNDAMVFELHMQNVAATGSPDVDRELGTTAAFHQNDGRAIGVGCLLAGRGFEMAHFLRLQNYGPSHAQYGIRIGTSLIDGPGNQPAVLNLDVVNPALTVPGLCAVVYTTAQITLPLGTTDAAGAIPLTFFDAPHDQSAEGVLLYSQVAALAPGAGAIPAALSDGAAAHIPVAPRPSPRCAYLYAASASTPTATLWRDRGVVVRFEQ